MVLKSEKNIIATSSAELFSAVLYLALACTGVLWRALACTGVLWRALLCRTQVLDNRNPFFDNRTQIT
jgi:fatty acid desaturase